MLRAIRLEESPLICGRVNTTTFLQSLTTTTLQPFMLAYIVTLLTPCYCPYIYNNIDTFTNSHTTFEIVNLLVYSNLQLRFAYTICLPYNNNSSPQKSNELF